MTTPPLREIRVLSVRQPWAAAIIYLGKDIENRSRAISPGPLLIHASTTVDRDGERIMRDRFGIDHLPAQAAWLGDILGRVDVTASTIGMRNTASRWAEGGQYHIHLANPVPANRRLRIAGKQWLFRPPEGWESLFTDAAGPDSARCWRHEKYREWCQHCREARA